MYLGQSQKSLRENWIPKDMIGSQLHHRLRTSTGRSLRIGPSRHTGGSRTHREHARELATALGRPFHPHEHLKKTHTKRNDEFVDLNCKSTYDVVLSKITSASQLVDEFGESPTVDYSKIYMDEEYVYEMKEEMKYEMREELHDEMKNKMQIEIQEQVDKILQERLPILKAGLPKPPPGT
uniref:Uncharacterized protein n=1 Tax=Solanum lycopersicum TaxID=4081 RepID=A0A3Q7GIH7_SOLLC